MIAVPRGRVPGAFGAESSGSRGFRGGLRPNRTVESKVDCSGKVSGRKGEAGDVSHLSKTAPPPGEQVCCASNKAWGFWDDKNSKIARLCGFVVPATPTLLRCASKLLPRWGSGYSPAGLPAILAAPQSAAKAARPATSQHTDAGAARTPACCEPSRPSAISLCP